MRKLIGDLGGAFIVRWSVWIAVALTNVWIAVLLGVVYGKPVYEAPLEDGSFYIFATTLVVTSFGALFFDLRGRQRQRRRPPSGAWETTTLSFGVVIGGSSALMYAATVMQGYGGLPIREGLEPWFSIGAAVMSIVYSLGCESIRQAMR